MVDWQEVGLLTAKVAEFIKPHIKEGASALEIAQAIEEKIFALGAKPAFPPNISINSIAAHYTPVWKDSTKFVAEDLVKIDFGLRKGLFCSDMAFSVSIGKNQQNEALIDAANTALTKAITKAKSGIMVCEIGKVIETVAKERGFSVIRNLTGHGLREGSLHAEPTIPNFDNGDKTKLCEGQIIAIEPFLTTGKGFVSETEQYEIFSFIKEKPIRQKEILSFVKAEYGPFPFARRWLIDKFGLLKTNIFIKEALALNVIKPYKVLKEVSGAKVAQAEHTIRINKNKTEILTSLL
ncbi:MAG: type II methionyl aminopeptidase [Candidatus Nanoarchaeia archaeon]